MKIDPSAIERDDETIKKQHYWYILAALLVFISVLIHQPLAFLAAIFTFIIGFVPDIWYRQGLHHLTVRQQINQHHLFFGEQVTLSVSIENRKFLPLPWLQITNSITPALSLNLPASMRLLRDRKELLNSTWQIWSYQRVTRRYKLRGQVRGFHVFGPVHLESCDPFGWLECSADVPALEALLVYPLIAPLEAIGLASFHPFGEHSSQRRLLEDPLRIAGVRDYLPGDDPRRIHWKATARAGELRSKIYEPSSLRRVLVLLDVYNHAERLSQADRDIQELSITAAASIALWAIEEGYMVGLLSNSAMIPYELPREGALNPSPDRKVLTRITAPGVSVPFSSDPGHSEHIISTLACLVPEHHTPIEHIIETEESMFPTGVTIVLVSAASTVSELTIVQLQDRRLHGAAVYLALTGEPEEMRVETDTLPVFYLGGREKWHELVATVPTEQHASGTSTTALQLD